MQGENSGLELEPTAQLLSLGLLLRFRLCAPGSLSCWHVSSDCCFCALMAAVEKAERAERSALDAQLKLEPTAQFIHLATHFDLDLYQLC